MDVGEWIGFFVSLLAFIILIANMAREERARKKDPEAYREKNDRKERLLKELFGEIDTGEKDRDEDEDDEEPVIVVKEKIYEPQKETGITEKKKTRLSTFEKGLEERRLELGKIGESIVSDHYRHVDINYVIGKKGVSKVYKRLSGLQRKKDIVIYKEIIDKPLALRDW